MPAKKGTKSGSGNRKSGKKKSAQSRKKVPVVKKSAPAILKSAAKPEPVKKGKSSGYGKADLEYFKKIILEKRKEILEELDTLKESMMDTTTGEYISENSTYSLHMEQGTDAMEREKTFLFASRESKFLNYLDDALQRIERGEYGRCNDCDKLIEKERLEAVPHAQLCLRCKLKRGR
jgi:RNA polymerase-binding protein DksA